MRLHPSLAALSLGGLAALGLGVAPCLAQTTAQAAAQPKAAIVLRAEQCLRQNVERVVASDHDVASAANFLVTYACATEVAGAARYQRNSAYVQMFSTMFKAMPVAAAAGAAAGAAATGRPPAPAAEFKASVDPETGDMVTPPSTPGAPGNAFATVLPLMDGIFAQVAPEVVPVGLRKLAGDLVLAAQTRAR